MKSCTRTGSGFPAGRHSLPLLAKSPTSSFFLVSTETTRLTGALKVPRLRVDVFELIVPVGVFRALASLARTLQAVVHVVQQLADLLRTDLMTHCAKLVGELPDALARPAQRRLRVPARHGLDERVQVRHQRRVFLGQRLAAGAWTPDSLLTRGLLGGASLDVLQLPNAVPDALAQDARRLGHGGCPAPPQRDRFARRPKARYTLVHHGREALKPRADLLNARLVDQHSAGLPHLMFPLCFHDQAVPLFSDGA
jgi:hypothetical protein